MKEAKAAKKRESNNADFGSGGRLGVASHYKLTAEAKVLKSGREQEGSSCESKWCDFKNTNGMEPTHRSYSADCSVDDANGSIDDLLALVGAKAQEPPSCDGRLPSTASLNSIENILRVNANSRIGVAEAKEGGTETKFTSDVGVGFARGGSGGGVRLGKLAIGRTVASGEVCTALAVEDFDSLKPKSQLGGGAVPEGTTERGEARIGGPYDESISPMAASTPYSSLSSTNFTAGACVAQCRSITAEQSNLVRDLLFGDHRRRHLDAWKKQGLFFSHEKGLGYGLVQREGGPCGVLAVLNAFVLDALLFGAAASSSRSESERPVATLRGLVSRGGGAEAWQDPPLPQLMAALLTALTHVIYTAASAGATDGPSASPTSIIVCLPKKEPHLYRSSTYSPDGFSERVQLCTLDCSQMSCFSTKAVLYSFLNENLHHFTDPTGCGALLLLYSSVFSRGLSVIKADMDDGFAGEVRTLCDRHSYLSQEGVNLLLLGRAVSNVFDGVKVLSDQVQGTEVSW